MIRQRTFLNDTAKLYLVATPIGNYDDMTFRAVKTLQEVDYIYCEDTRVTIKLLKHFNIETKLRSYHIFNENETTENLVNLIKQNINIAVVSDAGMPSISDPGYLACREAIKEGIDVVMVPGVSAGITALVGSGLTTNQYLFYGFLSSKKNKKEEELINISKNLITTIVYESPHRIEDTLNLIDKIMPNRTIVLAREITKKYEEYMRGTAKDILEYVDEIRGEIVIVIDQASKEELFANLNELTVLEHFNHYLNIGMNEKDAMKKVATDRGVPKGNIYKEIKVK